MLEPDDLATVVRADHDRLEQLLVSLRSSPSHSQGDRFVHELVHELESHASAERAILYPAVRQALGKSAAIDEMLNDHEMLKGAAVLLCRHHVGEQAFEVAVGALTSALRLHSSDEESTLLPRLREAVGTSTMRELGRRFERAKLLPAPDRPDPEGNPLRV